MSVKVFHILLIALSLSYRASGLVEYQPEQVHLSYGDNPFEIVVTWSTVNDTKESVVEYGINGFTLRAFGEPELFVHPGHKKKQQYIHRVTLGNLTEDSKYVYHCGSNFGWSEVFWFRTPPLDQENWKPRLAVYGDLGNENPQSLARLQSETQRGMYDAILHVGDFAYDLNTDGGRVGDEFMRQIESIAAYVPYMTCPGNHEEKHNFSQYKARFSMPGGDKGTLMYSFNMGPIHFISISTEVYYFLEYGFKLVAKQFLWLEEDLKEAVMNRTEQPWIVVFGHRPMYCSNVGHNDCKSHETRTRAGLPVLNMFGLEDLFHKYGVDLMIWAHEHSYERMWPLYNYEVYNGSRTEPYHNPGAPIHITSGSAGCKENITDFDHTPPDWSAFRSTDYGYMRLQPHNKTHLYLEQVSDDKDGMVIDHVWIVKDCHPTDFNYNSCGEYHPGD
ncbi:acid phosphatase type 7 [Anabrus simplex]|uniref:acid phosphatase type 7 n=1 Tax=Anabrus simplex TaxID=316456 RepID=UPI0035A2DCCB